MPKHKPPPLNAKDRMGCSFFLVLIWNGAIAGLWYYLIKTERWQEAPIFLILVTLPFALLGLLFLYGFIVNAMSLFNPRGTLKLDQTTVQPGDTIQVQWTFSGAIQRIRAVEIYAIGDIDSHKTTKSATEKPIKNFMPEHLLYRTDQSLNFAKGAATIQLPDEVQARIETRRARWKIQLRGSIRFWPDAYEEVAIDLKSTG